MHAATAGSSCTSMHPCERMTGERHGSDQTGVHRWRLDARRRDDGFAHPAGSRLRRLRGRAGRPRSREARAGASAGRADGQGPGSRHHGARDDGPPGGPRGLRRRPLELPARRLRRAGAGRADPAAPRRDRPGDAGARRLLHGSAGGTRAAACARRHRAGLPARQGLQLHESRQHPRAGRHAALRRGVRVALRGAGLLPGPDRPVGRARPHRARHRHGGPQSRLLERAPPVQGRGCDSPDCSSLGAP